MQKQISDSDSALQYYATCQISLRSGDFHFLPFWWVPFLGLNIVPIKPPFGPLNTKILKNEFQIRILQPNIVLGTRFHRSWLTFIFWPFWSVTQIFPDAKSIGKYSIQKNMESKVANKIFLLL